MSASSGRDAATGPHERYTAAKRLLVAGVEGFFWHFRRHTPVAAVVRQLAKAFGVPMNSLVGTQEPDGERRLSVPKTRKG
jgi:hypothetical protein